MELRTQLSPTKTENFVAKYSTRLKSYMWWFLGSVCADIHEKNAVVVLKHFSSPTNQYSVKNENFGIRRGISRSFV